MAREYMDHHGLEHWALAFVESRRRLRDCQFHDRIVRIARHLAIDDTDLLVFDTVLHETHPTAGMTDAGYPGVAVTYCRRKTTGRRQAK